MYFSAINILVRNSFLIFRILTSKLSYRQEESVVKTCQWYEMSQIKSENEKDERKGTTGRELRVDVKPRCVTRA